ncbi:mitochondrial 54S ribosomal protein uL2m [Aspergillus undulatus]|uniref:mitochondrial 54S ribosomal protein uL2m n=1 Tax=Aspergillus undulatus TaxID=1810928 RepID=UPI003CCD7E45
MLQQRVALRAIRLPVRCLPSITPRAYSTDVQQNAESPPYAESSSSTVDYGLGMAPPPLRQDSTVPVRKYTPRTPGVRHLRRPDIDHLWKGRPVHKLTFPKRGHSKGGRNNTGRVTVRHHGGGHKRRIRVVDFKRDAPGPHLVERIEHDPGRSAHIALLRSQETQKLSYIVAADGMRAGDVVQSYMAGIPQDLWESMGGAVDPGVLAARTAWRGNCLPLHMVPVGSLIYNVGLRPGQGAQLCRSAGTFATVISKGVNQIAAADKEIKIQKQIKREQAQQEQAQQEQVQPEQAQPEQAQPEQPQQEEAQQDQAEQEGAETKEKKGRRKKRMSQRARQARERILSHVTIRLSSGEVRLLHKDCCATIGVASNPMYEYSQLGKAGRSRWLNVRPTVRGLAMNAADHPHGGGRGKSKGNVNPKSPWGLPAKGGYKTRPRQKPNKAVVIPRVRNQGKRRRGYH